MRRSASSRAQGVPPGTAQPAPGTAHGAGGGPREPAIRFADAADLCEEPYPTWHEALAVARRLRAAGWVVVEQRAGAPRRPGGARTVAAVYHPATYESPGDVLCGPDP